MSKRKKINIVGYLFGLILFTTFLSYLYITYTDNISINKIDEVN